MKGGGRWYGKLPYISIITYSDVIKQVIVKKKLKRKIKMGHEAEE